MKKRVLILAGHRGSLSSILLIWALKNKVPSVKIIGVVCLSEFSTSRILSWYRRFGIGIIIKILAEIGLTKNRNSDINEEYKPLFDLKRKMGAFKPTLLQKFAASKKIPLYIVKDINSPKSVKLISSLCPNFTVYSGVGILKKAIIQASNRVLNIHCGPLPFIRGMNAVEWSLFLGLMPEKLLLHYIDEGIDTGRIIASRKLMVTKEDSLDRLRGVAKITGLQLLLDVLNDTKNSKVKENASNLGKQYFTMAEPLKFELREWIKNGMTPRSS